MNSMSGGNYIISDRQHLTKINCGNNIGYWQLVRNIFVYFSFDYDGGRFRKTIPEAEISANETL